LEIDASKFLALSTISAAAWQKSERIIPGSRPWRDGLLAQPEAYFDILRCISQSVDLDLFFITIPLASD